MPAAAAETETGPRGLELLHGAGGGEPVNRSHNAQSHGAVDRGQVRMSLGGEEEALDHEGSR